jgi:hypothetical protein
MGGVTVANRRSIRKKKKDAVSGVLFDLWEVEITE